MILQNKIMASLLSVTLLAGLVTGCGSSPTQSKNDIKKVDEKVPEYLNLTGYPIVNKPVTLKYMASYTSNHGPFDQMYVFTEFEKKSGIHIEWDTVLEGAVNEKRNLVLASNDLPDAFYRTKIPAKDVVVYGTQGSFIPMEGLINKYGTNLKKIFAEMPDVEKTIKAPDGKIYSLPGIYGYDGPKLNNFLWINTKWLDNVGMKMPATTDEYYNVLKAFKAKDANSNGKMDEIPFGGSKDRMFTDIIRGSFGLGTNGSGDFQADKDGKVIFIKTDPRFRETLEYVNKLYSEGLIDKEIFSTDGNKAKAKAAQGLYGSIYNNNPDAAGMTTNKEEYVGMLMLKGPHGDQVYSPCASTVAGVGTFTITSANKYPEATIRWVDYWYGDEGNELLHGGEKGKTYIMNSSGNMEYTEFITKNPNGMTQNQAIGQYSPWPGSNVPRIVIEKYNAQPLNNPDAKDARSKIAPYAPKDIWPAFLMTPEELDVVNTVGNDITQYTDEFITKFITGAEPLSNWDNYVKQVKQIGLDQLLKVQQAAYDRYSKTK